MRNAILLLISVAAFAASADDGKISFNYRSEDVVKVIEDYSKATGQRFIIDPDVKGKITIINRSPVTTTEAFNQLSTALAVNSLAISTQEDEMVVSRARTVERSLIETGSDLPPLKPEKLFTWVVKLKNIQANDVGIQVRLLASSNGELVPFIPTNQIIVTDWVSNLYRIQKIIKSLDDPANARMAKESEPAHTH